MVAYLVFGSTSTPLTSPIAQAASLSSSAAGLRMRMLIQVASPQLASPVIANASAIVDLRDKAMSMGFVMNLGSDPQAIQTLGSSTLRMQMILDGSALYMKLPQAEANALPALGGKTWLKLDTSSLKGVPGLSSLGSDPTLENPTHMLQVLESEASNVVNEGKQSIDGFETTHYRAYLNLSQIGAHLTPSQQAQVQQAISAFEQVTKSQDIPVDVWIDPYGLLRRMVMAVDLSLPNGGSAQETVTADLSDYGAQPRPVLPPGDQVQDLASLIHISNG